MIQTTHRTFGSVLREMCPIRHLDMLIDLEVPEAVPVDGVFRERITFVFLPCLNANCTEYLKNPLSLTVQFVVDVTSDPSDIVEALADSLCRVIWWFGFHGADLLALDKAYDDSIERIGRMKRNLSEVSV